MITIKCNVSSTTFKIGGKRIFKGVKKYNLDAKDPAIRYQLRVLRDEGIIEYKEKYPPVDQKTEVPVKKETAENDNAEQPKDGTGSAGDGGSTDISDGDVSGKKSNKSAKRGRVSK